LGLVRSAQVDAKPEAQREDRILWCHESGPDLGREREAGSCQVDAHRQIGSVQGVREAVREERRESRLHEEEIEWVEARRCARSERAKAHGKGAEGVGSQGDSCARPSVVIADSELNGQRSKSVLRSVRGTRRQEHARDPSQRRSTAKGRNREHHDDRIRECGSGASRLRG